MAANQCCKLINVHYDGNVSDFFQCRSWTSVKEAVEVHHLLSGVKFSDSNNIMYTHTHTHHRPPDVVTAFNITLRHLLFLRARSRK